VVAACGSPPSDGPRVEGDPVGVVGAHEHGVARLSLAVDSAEIHMMLDVPGDVLFGFERAPRTDEERTLVAKRVGALESGLASAVVLPAGLGCRAAGPVQLEGVPDPADAGEHAGEEEHEESDDNTHGEDTHDEHTHDEEGQHEGAEPEDHAGDHLEVTAEVTLTCERSPEGAEATLAILDLLPELELVDLTVLTSKGDAAARVAGDAAFGF